MTALSIAMDEDRFPPMEAYAWDRDMPPGDSHADSFTVEPAPFNAEAPQPLVREIPLGESYPIEALGALREAVEAVQGMTLAPLAIPAASALTIAALATQGHVDVETLGGNRPVSLYALTIAQSGERKSSCDAPLMAAMKEFNREQSKAQREKMAAWENDFALWKGERERILNEAKKNRGEKRIAAEVDLDALGPEPAAPPTPSRLVGGQSTQGITRQLREGMPSLGLFSDEGGKFLGGWGMKSENRMGTMAALNDAWQGTDISVSLAGEGSYTLYGRRLSIHLMVQPLIARNLLADPLAGDTGLLPRFLICEPPSTIGTRLQSKVRRNSFALEAFGQRLKQILEAPLPMDPETRELHPRIISLSPAARSTLAAFADHVEAHQAHGGEYANITGYASKAAEHAARIAGVMSAWVDLDVAEVSLATMQDAIVLAQYYLNEARRLSDAAVVSAEVERAEKLREWLLKKWPHTEVLPSEVVRHAPVRALRESPAAKDAIAMLAKHGWLVRLSEGVEVRGKSRKEAYRIVRASDEV